MPEELPEDHPMMVEATRQLSFRMSLYRGLDMTVSTVASMREVVKDHRKQWRLKGVDFPELVPLVVLRVGIFDLKRADLEPRSIAIALINFTRDHPDVMMEETIDAFSRAYGSRVHIDDMRKGVADARADMMRRVGTVPRHEPEVEARRGQ